MSLSEGLNATMSCEGATIAKLADVEFECTADVVEWADMGETLTSEVLHGVRTFKGMARKGYINNTYLDYFIGGSALIGTIFPRGGTTPYIAGTFEITNWKCTGMTHEAADPVLEELSFIMYDITKS
jgi:hypothetical protein